MHFLSSAYFWLLSVVAVLAVLYFWLRHARRTVVPALFLWDVKEAQPDSGRTLRLTRLPFSFYLEAIAIALLAFAAAMPFLLRNADFPPLVLVLDNSFSMSAASQGYDVKERCWQEITTSIAQHPGRTLHCVLAGSSPQEIEATQSDIRENWRCDAVSADMEAAVSVARRLCKNGEIIVFTDHSPETKIRDVRWMAFGKKLSNVAIVNARRSGDKVLLEVYNASGSSVGVTLDEKSNGGIAPMDLTLQPNQIRKLDFTLNDIAKPAEFVLDAKDDSIKLDNSVVLLAEERAPLSYRIDDGLSEKQQSLLKNTLLRNSEYLSVGARELCIGNAGLQSGNYHRLIWHGEGKQISREPMTTRTDNYGLLQGLSFADLIWPADPALELPGKVMLYQGDVPLISVEERGTFLDIYLNLNETAGNLNRQIFWPAFFWNLSNVLRGLRQGPDRVNVRCGDIVTFANPMKESVMVDGKTVQNSYPNAHVLFSAPGMHAINTWNIAVNCLNKEESDISKACSCDIAPEMAASPLAQTIKLHLGFAFILAAIAVLLVHWYMTVRKK